MRPVAAVGSMRACGGTIFQSLSYSVMVGLLPICVLGSLDSHGGIAITADPLVCADNIPVCGLGDINDMCKWVYPPHFTQPIVVGDLIVSIL